MTEELSKKLVCVLLRVGVELWLEEERANKLMDILKSTNAPQFIEFEGQLINKADISGIFDALTMEERTRRKNGEWKCSLDNWHARFEKCECLSDEYLDKRREDYQEFYRIHGYWPLGASI